MLRRGLSGRRADKPGGLGHRTQNRTTVDVAPPALRKRIDNEADVLSGSAPSALKRAEWLGALGSGWQEFSERAPVAERGSTGPDFAEPQSIPARAAPTYPPHHHGNGPPAPTCSSTSTPSGSRKRPWPWRSGSFISAASPSRRHRASTARGLRRRARRHTRRCATTRSGAWATCARTVTGSARRSRPRRPRARDHLPAPRRRRGFSLPPSRGMPAWRDAGALHPGRRVRRDRRADQRLGRRDRPLGEGHHRPAVRHGVPGLRVRTPRTAPSSPIPSAGLVEQERVPSLVVWEKPGRDKEGNPAPLRMQKDYRVVPRGCRPRHRLQHLPDLERLPRPVRLARHRQPGHRQAAPAGRAAARHLRGGLPVRCCRRRLQCRPGPSRRPDAEGEGLA